MKRRTRRRRVKRRTSLKLSCFDIRVVLGKKKRLSLLLYWHFLIVIENGKQKIGVYTDLKKERNRIWYCQKVDIMPIVIRSLGTGYSLKSLDLQVKCCVLRKACLFGKSRNSLKSAGYQMRDVAWYPIIAKPYNNIQEVK